LEKLLVGIHGGLAMLSGRVEWMLDTSDKIFDGKTEAEFLAQSIKDVAGHYGAGVFDQKTLDWMNLTQCLLIVYAGRIFTIRSNPKPKPVRQPTPAETAQTFSPGPNVVHTDGMNGATHANEGEIAGIGTVEFPPDHPLSVRKH
jgi:hypothetical protein